jgi:hypothetical protein
MLINPLPPQSLAATEEAASSASPREHRTVAQPGTPVECLCIVFNEAAGSKAGKDGTSSLTKLPKFFLDSGAVGGFIDAAAQRVLTIHLCRLYTRIYCVSVDTVAMTLSVVDVAGSPHEQTPIARSFPLYGEGRMFLSVVDNLLCVHVPAIRVTLVYDIASEGDRPVANPMSLVCVKSNNVGGGGGGGGGGRRGSGSGSGGSGADGIDVRSRNTTRESSSNWRMSEDFTRRSSSQSGASSSSLAANLINLNADGEHSTIATSSGGGGGGSGGGDGGGDASNHQDISQLDPYGDDWQFHWPHWAVHTVKYVDSGGDNADGDEHSAAVLERREVWKLQVNLVAAIRCSFGSSPGVVTAFLMRRSLDGFMSSKVQRLRLKGKETRGTYAKYLLLSELLSSARQGVDLGKIVAAFNVLSRVYRVALAERANQITAKKHRKGTRDRNKGGRAAGAGSAKQSSADGSESEAALNPSVSVLAEEHNKRDASGGADVGGNRSLLKRRVSMVPPAVSVQAVRTLGGMIVVLQRDVYKHIIQPLLADPSVNDDWAYAIMFEYLRSLQRFQIPGK